MESKFTRAYIEELSYKLKSGTITKQERADFEEWYDSKLHKDVELPATFASDSNELKERIYLRITNNLDDKSIKKKVFTIWKQVSVAASILLILSFGTYYLYQKKPNEQNTQELAKSNDIAPGQNQAMLTLANGQKIIINNSLKGREIKMGNSIVKINNDNTLTYTMIGTSAIQTQYNTFSTVRGEQSPFPLRLPDGTKVWLNAQSSISFPSAFNGNERLVKLTGEAYFEVIHDEKQPFKVLVKDQTIEDLGTTFNINSYNDEPDIKTTLISGSIKVITGRGKSALIKPGEMATTVVNSDMINVREVNIENATAWKNGYFLFDDEPLESVMRKIARWYNVDIEYAKDEKINEIFGGSISRYTNISQVLKILEATGDVHFTVEGKKVIVSKK